MGAGGERGEWADGLFSLASNFWWSCWSGPLSVLADSTVKWKENKLCREQRDLSLSQTQSQAGCCSAWSSHSSLSRTFCYLFNEIIFFLAQSRVCVKAYQCSEQSKNYLQGSFLFWLLIDEQIDKSMSNEWINEYLPFQKIFCYILGWAKICPLITFTQRT